MNYYWGWYWNGGIESGVVLLVKQKANEGSDGEGGTATSPAYENEKDVVVARTLGLAPRARWIGGSKLGSGRHGDLRRWGRKWRRSDRRGRGRAGRRNGIRKFSSYRNLRRGSSCWLRESRENRNALPKLNSR